MGWCEAEMREVEPAVPPRRTGAKRLVGGLRSELSARNLERAGGFAHEVTRGVRPSVIYAPGDVSGPGRAGHGNFLDASYKRILADADWAKRLEKAHTAKRQGTRPWRELDSAMSSDALLMNVFCYPRVLARGGLTGLLGVETGVRPEFGYKPRVPLLRGLVDTTEVDLRLGDLLVEAKLTEGDFQTAPARKLERYREFGEVFERELLPRWGEGYSGYQLIRGVLAAWHVGGRFCVVCDARRPDLVEEWFSVMRAVRSFELRGRMRLVTWQEIGRVLPERLRQFLAEKYGVAG